MSETMSKTIEEYCDRLTPLILDGLQKGWPSFEWELKCKIDLSDIQFYGRVLAINGKKLEKPYMRMSPCWSFFKEYEDELIVKTSIDFIGTFIEKDMRRVVLLV